MRKRSLLRAIIVLLAMLGIAASAMAQDRAAKKAKRAGAKRAVAATQPVESPSYDVLYQVHVPTFADLIAPKIKAFIDRDVASRKPGEPEDAYAVRKLLGEGFAEPIAKAIKELQTVSLGWRLDRAEKRTYLDLTLLAQPGTGLAQRFAQAADLKTAFGGFRVPGAALAAHWAGQTPPNEAEVWVKVVETVRQRELKKIDSHGIPDDQKPVVKDLANKLFDVARDSAASGRSDGALSLVLNPKSVTLVAGAYVADGPKLEGVVKAVAEHLQKRHPNVATLKLDAEKYEGVNFHTLSIPAPQNLDRARFIEAFGESLEVVVGFGPKAAYLAAGRDAVKSLKEAIQRSSSPTSLPTPFEISVAAKPLADFVAAMGRPFERGPAQRAAEVLAPAGGKDHVRILVKPIERGAILRLDVEEGVLRLIGKISPEVKEFLLGK